MGMQEKIKGKRMKWWAREKNLRQGEKGGKRGRSGGREERRRREKIRETRKGWGDIKRLGEREGEGRSKGGRKRMKRDRNGG